MKKGRNSHSKSKKQQNKKHPQKMNQQVIKNLEPPSVGAAQEPPSQNPELSSKKEPARAAQEPPSQVEKQVSEKQLEANRQNAQKAQGPTSETGKATSSQNSISHGAYTGKALIKSESQAEFDAFYKGLYKCFNPTNELYALYVDDYIWASWKARRFRIYEAGVLNEKSSNAIESIKELDRLTRIEQRIERNRERALKKIESYKKQLFNEEMHKKMEEAMARRNHEIEKQRNSSHIVIPNVGAATGDRPTTNPDVGAAPCGLPTTNPQADNRDKTPNGIPPSVEEKISKMLSDEQHPLMGKGKMGSFCQNGK